jgi:hypothetical protein
MRTRALQVDKVMSKAEIWDWLRRYRAIPAKNRDITFVEIAKRMHYTVEHLKDALYEKDGTNMSPEIQVRFTAFVNEYGQPKQRLPEERGPRPPIPDEVYLKFAEAVACLPTDLAAYYGINKEVYLSCRHGVIPKFRRATFERLYERLTKERFVW